MDNFTHGASDATTAGTTAPSEALPSYLSTPHRCALVTANWAFFSLRAPGRPLPPAARDAWMVGHLLHGSGFTAQVLAKTRQQSLARGGMIHHDGWCCQFAGSTDGMTREVLSQARRIIRPVRVSQDGSLSTSGDTAPQASSGAFPHKFEVIGGVRTSLLC